jgi:Helitron helicase-like domain at N-terminus
VADEVALLLPNEENDRPRREIILTARPARDAPDQIKPLHQIPYTYPLYHILHYVLLYPFGEPGRDFLMRLLDPHGVRKRDRITIQMYHRYLIYTRSNTFNIKHRDGRLFQQWLVDVQAAVERERLNYLDTHQKELRVENYHNLQERLDQNAANQDAVNPAAIDKVAILPSSFPSGDRAMQQLFQDSMCLITHFSKPDLFMTFTANPKWEEVTAALFTDQTVADRPDIIAKVFRAKLKDLID